MSSASWLRLFLLSRYRNQLWRFFPLFSKRSKLFTGIQHRLAFPTLTALPLWLMVRAAKQTENSYQSNQSKNIATIVEQLDTMFDKEEFQKAYEYIEKNKTNELFQSHYIRWRIARIFYKLSLITKDKKLKKKLVEDGFEQIKLALESGNHIYSVHKWYGILLNEKSQYTSTDEQIRSAYEVLDHFEEAIRLNPQDPTSYYLLGSWYWEISQLSSWKRRLAKLIYGELPQGTVHDALKKFILAEEISPNFYSKNLLMIVKCYIELNSRPAAMEFAKLLLNRERKTQEDEEVHQELLKLIPRMEHLLPYPQQGSFSKHMLSNLYFRQTSRRFIIISTRATLSISTNKKHEEIPTTSQHYSNNKFNVVDNTKSLPSNNILEVRRLEKKSDHLNRSLSQDVKVSNAYVLEGVPINTNITPLTSEEQRKSKDTEEYLQHERAPSSSRFSVFLRSIRSGLPLLSSTKSKASSMNIATTREHFIPLTRPSLIRLLATDNQLLDNDEDRLLFHQLCEVFDSAVVQRYHPILNDLKNLFNPLNPDNEIYDYHHISQRNRLDNEYWLLQKIDDLLQRSNFTELPRSILLEKFIVQKHSSSSNVNVKINGYDYDVLKFWILGRERIPNEQLSRWKRLFRKSNKVISNDYFKRIILAVRLKGQDRLYLKAFRDMPLQDLPQLLPVGKLQIGQYEQRLIWSTFFIGTITAVTHLITTMADIHLPSLVIGGSSLTLLLALWSLKSSYRSKIDYLSNMNRLLFYKNIASNKQLLAMIIDRAEDELSKDILIAYMIILWRQKQHTNLTTNILELEIENWIRMKINTNINFKSDQSIEFLRKLGIVLPDDPSKPGRLQVIPLKQVVGILPKISRTLSEKNEEWDLIEGYDKKYFEVDWKTVLNEDKLLQKDGWR